MKSIDGDSHKMGEWKRKLEEGAVLTPQQMNKIVKLWQVGLIIRGILYNKNTT